MATAAGGGGGGGGGGDGGSWGEASSKKGCNGFQIPDVLESIFYFSGYYYFEENEDGMVLICSLHRVS